MKASKETIQKIWRDLFISLLLYALPVLLMLLSFKITGQQPWKNKVPVSHTQTK
jgi:hypothetical protein